MRAKSNNGIKWLIYLLMASTVFGSNILTVKLAAGLSLFPFRVIFVLVSYLFLLVFLFNRGGFDISHIKVRPYIKFLLFWILYAFFSFLWAKDRPSTIKDLIFLFTNISIILFVVYYFTNLKDFERFYNLWLFILLLLISIGLWNNITGHQLTEYEGIPSYYEGVFMHTPRATFNNPNDYATYLALSVPFVITFIRYAKNSVFKLFGVFILLVCIYLIIFTFSRSNYIAILIGFVFWYLFLVKNVSSKIKIVLISIFLFLFFLFSTSFMETIGDIFFTEIKSLTEQSDSGSMNIRSNLVKNSFLFLINSFGFGIGAGNSEYYMEHYSVYNTHGITDVHNWWIELLLEYGIFFFLAYLLFYLNIFINLYKVYKRLKNVVMKKICESLLIGLVVFLFASISSSSILNLIIQWMLFAFCLGFLNYCRNYDTKCENISNLPHVSLYL